MLTRMILLSIFGLALIIRIVNLTSLPIFTDEAIYIRWTQIANADPAWRFISLTDGKQPLFIWFNIISQRLFNDPLFAGRVISAIAGAFTALGLYFLGSLLFNKRIALISSFIWAVFPLAVWYDRLALMDSLLACFAVWSLWLEVLLVKSLRLDVALILGLVLGGGLLTKSSAQFFIYWLPFNLLVSALKIKKPNKKIFSWIGLVFVAIIIALSINSIQRLSPFYYIIGLKNLTFIYSGREIFSFGLLQNWQRFWGNLSGLLSWLSIYLTPSFIFLILLSLINFKNHFKVKLYLISCFLFPFLALTFFGKVLYSRFFLFMTVPLVILIADGIEKINQIKNHFLLFVIYFLLFSYPLYFTSKIIFNPLMAPLPKVDRGQYLDDWPSGWGIKEVVEYLKQESKGKKIAIGTEGTFGLTPAALEIYLQGNQNVEIKGFWPISDGLSWLKDKAKEKETFLMFKDTQTPDPSWPLKLVAKYQRGKGDNYLFLYLVLPQ